MADAPRPYVDKYGHRYTEAIFRNWHPRIIEFMEITKARRSPAEVAEDEATRVRSK